MDTRFLHVPDEDTIRAYLRLNYATKTDAELTYMLNITHWALMHYACEMNLSKNATIIRKQNMAKINTNKY